LRLGKVPATYRSIVITVPDDVALEMVDPSEVPGWDSADYEAGQTFAGPWFRDQRTAVLRVPSAVARPYEWNVVVNPAHPDAARITHGPVVPVVWDERLFAAARWRYGVGPSTGVGSRHRPVSACIVEGRHATPSHPSATPIQRISMENPAARPEQARYRYADFPELFWDAQPDALIDPANPIVLARVLARGSMRAVASLLTMELIRENLDRVAVEPHVRAFWRRVVALPVRPRAGV